MNIEYRGTGWVEFKACLHAHIPEEVVCLHSLLDVSTPLMLFSSGVSEEQGPPYRMRWEGCPGYRGVSAAAAAAAAASGGEASMAGRAGSAFPGLAGVFYAYIWG